MNNAELLTAIGDLQELRRMQEELSAEIEALQDRIKAHMNESGVDALTVGAWRVTYQPVTSSRFDSAAFKAAMPDVAARFTKTTTARRFTVR